MRWVVLFSFPFTEGKLRFKEVEYPTQDDTTKKYQHQGWTRPVHSVCPMPSPCPQPWKENIVPLLTWPVVLSPSSTCHNPSQELCRSTVVPMRHIHSGTYSLKIQIPNLDFLHSSLDPPFTSYLTLNNQLVPSFFHFPSCPQLYWCIIDKWNCKIFKVYIVVVWHYERIPTIELINRSFISDNYLLCVCVREQLSSTLLTIFNYTTHYYQLESPCYTLDPQTLFIL